MSNRRKLAQRKGPRMEHVRNRSDQGVPMTWLQAVEWGDGGDPVWGTAETFSVLPGELVA